MRAALGLRDRALALLSLGIVLGVGAVGTTAFWTDDSVATSTFSTGTVKIGLTGASATTASFTDLAVSTLKPGQTKAAVIQVRNRGTLPFGYTVGAETVSDNGLATSLAVVVRTDSTVVTSGTSSTCSTGGTSTQVYSRTGWAGAAVAASQTLPAVGATGADTNLCVQVGLPTGAPNGTQGDAMTGRLTFSATNL